MTLKNTNTDVLLERSSRCESETGMRHISFWLVGFDLTVVGQKVGMSSIRVVRSSRILNNNGNLEIAVNTETGNE
jgi:hypothetical protein